MVGMSTRLRSDPELAAIIERARQEARAADELQPSESRFLESPLSPAAREVLASWVQDGGYDRALAEVAADDPELADQ